jgi:cell division protein FtsZ
MRLADAGIAELQRYVDTLIVIPNQNLFRIANERTTLAEAFAMADQVLHSGVRSITDLMVLPGLINLDFADVRTVMTEMGKAMMGTGEATGEDRALVASQNAIANPLLDEVSLKGARAVLVNVTGGMDMTLLEVDEAANAISDQVDPEANIIFGAAFDPSLDGKIRVSVVATGMDGQSIAAIEPKPVRAAQPALAPMTMREPITPQREPVAAAASVATVQPQPEPRTIEPAIAEDDFDDDDGLELAAETRPAFTRDAPLTLDLTPQGDLYEAPASIEPERTAASAQTEAEEEALIFPSRSRLGEDPQQQKSGGWLSLFGGRSRNDQPPPLRDYRGDPTPVLQARAAAQAQAVQPAPEAEAEAGEDLEIPSFLRRLAN